MGNDIINTRIVSAASTVPAGVAATGTVTVDTNDTSILRVSGSTLTTLQNESKFTKQNMYVYAVTSEILAKVKGISGTDLLVTDGDFTGVSGETYQFIEANLVSYSIENVGAGTATVDGEDLGAGKFINVGQKEQVANARQFAYVAAVTVDGSSSNLRIVEQQ